jgi:hypothetical protein
MPENVHSGGSVRAIAHRASIVYEEETGAIKHIHRTITLEGGRVPSDSELEEAALAIISKRLPVGGLKVVHVEPDQIRPHVRYRVHPQHRTLIEPT